MGDVIDLNSRRKPNPETIRLFKISTKIDAIITQELNEGKVPLKDLAGVIAHRLGNFLSIVDKKKELFDVCCDVMKKAAKIE